MIYPSSDLSFAYDIGNSDSVIAYFYSLNCPSCKLLSPILEDISSNFSNIKLLKFIKLNVQDNPLTLQEYSSVPVKYLNLRP